MTVHTQLTLQGVGDLEDERHQPHQKARRICLCGCRDGTSICQLHAEQPGTKRHCMDVALRMGHSCTRRGNTNPEF